MRSYLFLSGTFLLALSAQMKLPTPQPAIERQVQNAREVGDGDYETRVLRERMAKEPDNLEVRLALARRYQAMGSTELALEHYRLAAARFPENPEVHLLLGKTLRRIGSRGEATNMLQEFLRAHPQQSPDSPRCSASCWMSRSSGRMERNPIGTPWRWRRNPIRCITISATIF